jgi:hypothetical protein
MDVLFLDEMSFEIPLTDGRRYEAASPSIEEAVRKSMAHVGIELIDYDTVRFYYPPLDVTCTVSVRSKAWKERVQRTPASA